MLTASQLGAPCAWAGSQRLVSKNTESGPLRCLVPGQIPWTYEECTDDQRLAQQVLESLLGLETINTLTCTLSPGP